MVNLVIVSHCLQLAAGAKELACSMAGNAIKIAAVGGVMNEDGSYRLGTDAIRIYDAIHDIWEPDGVLLLVDLGSSVLSAELAIDMLPDEMRAGCLVSNAPLVEGAVVAALEASVSQPLEAVNRAAEGASSFDKVTRD